MNETNTDSALSEKLKALVNKYEQALAVDMEFDKLKQIYLQIKEIKVQLKKADKKRRF